MVLFVCILAGGGLVATCSGAFFVFCPVCCLVLVFSRSCLVSSGAGCVAFLWFVACVLSVMVCLPSSWCHW